MSTLFQVPALLTDDPWFGYWDEIEKGREARSGRTAATVPLSFSFCEGCGVELEAKDRRKGFTFCSRDCREAKRLS